METIEKPKPSRSNLKLAAIAIVVLLVGVIIGYATLSPQVSSLQTQVKSLQTQVDSLKGQFQPWFTLNKTYSNGYFGTQLSFDVKCPSLVKTGSNLKIYFTFTAKDKIYWQWLTVDGWLKLTTYYDGSFKDPVNVIAPTDIWYKDDTFTKVISITPTKNSSILVQIAAAFFDKDYKVVGGNVIIPLGNAVPWV